MEDTAVKSSRTNTIEGKWFMRGLMLVVFGWMTGWTFLIYLAWLALLLAGIQLFGDARRSMKTGTALQVFVLFALSGLLVSVSSYVLF